MYSATEAIEDAVEAFSQSLSVFLLGFLLNIGNDSIDSTLLGRERENKHCFPFKSPISSPDTSPVEKPDCCPSSSSELSDSSYHITEANFLLFFFFPNK